MVGEARPVEVHLFAAARAAAGVPMVQVAAGPLAEVLAQVVREYPDLGAVLPRCSTLVDGLAATEDDVVVPGGGRVDVLPPFAGG
jgi:molybdopterin converting factor small subunit